MPTNPYGPPLIDFSGLNPIGSYEQGASLRRSYELRKGLSKIAPDDFQGMARLLAQFGDPKDAVNMMQLQNQLRHQSVQEELAAKQLEQSTRSADALVRARVGNEARKQAIYDEPLGAIESGVPGYAEARNSLLSNRFAGGLQSGFNAAPIKEIQGFAGALADARHLTGQARKAYVEDHTPGALDFIQGTAKGMFDSLEADAKRYGYEVPAYVEKAAPPPPANSPAAAGRGAPGLQSPVTVSPSGLNQEGAAAAPTARPVPTVTIRMVPGTNIQIPPALANKHLTFDRLNSTFIDKETGERFNTNGDPVSGQP